MLSRAKRYRENGQALVEMAVAIGLSGFFVLLLSGLMSKTLMLSTTSQNELIAAHAAEELLENARIMTFSQIDNLPASGVPLNAPISFLVNADGTTSQTNLRPSSMPVQLDLTDTSTIYGAVNPSSSTKIDPNRKWTPGSGNYFTGTATETINGPNSAGGPRWYEIVVEISYNAGTTAVSNTRKLTRRAYVVEQGLNLQ